MPIAVRGQPAAYTIVVSEKASPSQRYAAEELRDFTEKMTGVKLPIATDAAPLPLKAVLIGETKYSSGLISGAQERVPPIGTDGFRLVARSPHLLVIGSPDRGALYGVYELLERFGGCRWYASWRTVIPSLQEFTVPAALDETQVPAFLMREPFWYDQFNAEMAYHNKCNGNAMRLDDRHGGRIRFGSGLFVHTFDHLIPVDEFPADEEMEAFVKQWNDAGFANVKIGG